MKALKKIAALIAFLLILGGAICSIYCTFLYAFIPGIAAILLSLAAVPTEVWLVRYMMGK